MTKQLGVTFGDEVIAAGLGGKPFTWGDTDDSIHGRENLTAADNTTLDSVVAAHDPTDERENIISTSDFIGRWTDEEYLTLEQTRAANISTGTIGNAKAWDMLVAEDHIDMNQARFQNMKAALVADGILTQARADEIFDTPPATE